MIKRFIFAVMFMAVCSKAYACIDCTGVGTNATFTGTLTGTNLAGTTLSVTAIVFANGDVLYSSPSFSLQTLPLTTTYIQNRTSLQAGTTFYLASGTVQNLNVATANVTSIIFGDGTKLISAFANTSTTTIAYNLILTTSGGGNNLAVATASYINIMGCEAVNFSSSASLAKNGPGGLDIGVSASSQSYTLLAIADNACTQFGVLFTSQPLTRPIMPAGFTKWRPLTSFYNAAGSSLITQVKRGRRVTRQANQFICDIANLAATPSQFDMTQWVSSNAVSATFHFVAQGAGGAGGTAAVIIRANGQVGGGPNPDQMFTYQVPDVVAGFEIGQDITVPIIDNRTLTFYEGTNIGEFVLFMTGYEEEY